MSAAVTLFTACNNTDDLYNPNWNGELGVIVPENFDWSTTQTLNVRVDVKDEHHGKYNYHVGIYTESPTDGVLPVSVGIAKSGMPFDAAITIPATVNKLYITQTLYHSDGTKSTSVGEAKVEGTNIVYAFTESVKKAGTRAVETLSSSNYCSLDEAREYIDNLKPNETIIVETNKTIEATSMSTKDKYIVKSGATLTINGNVSSKNNTIYIIEEGATIHCNNNIELGSHASLINNGSFTSSGTITITNDATIFNNGCITASHIYLNNAGNNGKEIEGSVIMYEDAFLGASSMKIDHNNTIVIMSRGSRISVTGTVEAQGTTDFLPFDNSKVEGSEYGSLFQMKELKLEEKGKNFTVPNPILVECPNITGEKSIISTIVSSNASSLISISGTACSGSVGKEEEYILDKYTYCMEDMYPEAGDYDMNDIVLEIEGKAKSIDGYTTQLTFDCKLRAVGATKSIAAYINLKDVPQTALKDGSNPIKLIDDAHTLMGSNTKTPINTIESEEAYPEKTFSITVEFQEEAIQNINIDMLDFYIIADGTEIHLPNINRTPSYIDGTTIWGVRVPGPFKYMKELVRISDGYTKLNSWIESNKTKDRDWYNYFDKSKVYNK